MSIRSNLRVGALATATLAMFGAGLAVPASAQTNSTTTTPSPAATGGLAATATPAAAVGGCPAGQLCLYAGTNFTNMKLQTGSIDSCWDLPKYGLTSVKSYVNNMSVKATGWDLGSDGEYYLDGTILPGRFSSNAGAGFGYYGIACTE